MKQLILLLLVLSVTLLIACGGGNTSGATEDNASVTSSVPETESSTASEDSSVLDDESSTSSDDISIPESDTSVPEEAPEPKKPENILYYESDYSLGFKPEPYINNQGLREIGSGENKLFNGSFSSESFREKSLFYAVEYTEIPNDAYFFVGLGLNPGLGKEYTVEEFESMRNFLEEKGFITEKNHPQVGDISEAGFGTMFDAVGYMNLELYEILSCNEEFGTEVTWLCDPETTEGVTAFFKDSIIWNTDPEVFRYIKSFEKIVSCKEVQSRGLLTYINENGGENDLYCLLLAYENDEEIEQIIKKHNFVDDVAYFERYFEAPEGGTGRIGYATKDLILELVELNKPMCYTWMPSVADFETIVNDPS